MISVIVPVYQAEKHLNRCVDSIINQKYRDIEVILIDDGSTDNSGNICDNYAKQDKRIKVLHKKNAGVSAARNSGLEIATGDYITFVDSDDYIDSCMYSRMVKIAEEYSCDVVMCDCMKEDGETSLPYTHNIRGGYYNKSDLENEYYPHILIMENVEYPATISNCLLVIKREISTGLPIPKYISGIRYSEDLVFGAELMKVAGSFYYLKGEYYYHYVMNPFSATHRFVSDKWKDYLILFDRAQTIFDMQDAKYSIQVNKMLLFFVYNAVGDILHTNQYGVNRKVDEVKKILTCSQVRKMFRSICVFKLPISNKLKILTLAYKYRIGIRLLSKR